MAIVAATPAAGKRSGASPWLRWGGLALATAAVVAWFLVKAAPEEVAGGPGAGQGGAKATPVSVAPVTRGAFAAHASFAGELDGDAADVGALVAGRVAAMHVRLGDRVEAGQLVAEIDVSELREQRLEAAAQIEAAAAARLGAVVALRAANRELNRTRELTSRGIASAQDADLRAAEVEARRAAAATARAQETQAQARVATLDQRIGEARVVAPFAGTIAERRLDPGGFVAVGATLVRVVAREPLRVRFEVPERVIADLHRDAPFRVRAPPTGALERVGHVIGTSGEVARERRVVIVEGVIDDPPESWLPGMYADVETVRRALDDALIVPEQAVLSRLDADGTVKTGVFAPVDGRARWVPVEVLAREGERAAVAGELVTGTEVLVGGHTDLADGGAILVAAPAGAKAKPAAGPDATPAPGAKAAAP